MIWQNNNSKNLCFPMFIAAQFTIAKCWKQPKCPSVNEWIQKLWYIYTMEFYAAERKKELLPFATAWVTCTNVTLGERNLTRMSNSFSPGATSASGLPSKGQM